MGTVYRGECAEPCGRPVIVPLSFHDSGGDWLPDTHEAKTKDDEWVNIRQTAGLGKKPSRCAPVLAEASFGQANRIPSSILRLVGVRTASAKGERPRRPAQALRPSNGRERLHLAVPTVSNRPPAPPARPTPPPPHRSIRPVGARLNSPHPRKPPSFRRGRHLGRTRPLPPRRVRNPRPRAVRGVSKPPSTTGSRPASRIGTPGTRPAAKAPKGIRPPAVRAGARRIRRPSSRRLLTTSAATTPRWRAGLDARRLPARSRWATTPTPRWCSTPSRIPTIRGMRRRTRPGNAIRTDGTRRAAARRRRMPAGTLRPGGSEAPIASSPTSWSTPRSRRSSPRERRSPASSAGGAWPSIRPRGRSSRSRAQVSAPASG